MKLPSLLLSCSILGFSLASATHALAQGNRYYYKATQAANATATSGDWSNSNAEWYWYNGTTPVAGQVQVAWGTISANNQVAYLQGPGSGSYDINVTEDLNVYSVTFNNASYDLAGSGSLRMGGGNLTVGNTGGGRIVSIDVPVHFTASGALSAFAGSAMTIDAPLTIDQTPGRTSDLTIGLNSAGVIALKGDNTGLAKVREGDRFNLGGTGAGEIHLYSSTSFGDLQLAINGGTNFRFKAQTGNLTFDNQFRPNGIGSSTHFGLTGAHDITFTDTLKVSQAITVSISVDGAGVLTLGGIERPSGTNSAQLVKDGVGTFVTSGTSSYTGTTTVSAGTLKVNGTHTNTGGVGAYTIADQGTLGGSGTINAVVSVEGTLNPDDADGGLGLTLGALTMGDGSAYRFAGDNAVNVTGSLLLETGWGLTLSGAKLRADAGGSLVLATFGTLAAGSDLAPVIQIEGLGIDPGSLSLSQVGNTVVLHGVTMAAIPEPSSLVMLGCASAFGYLLARRRRRRG